MKAVPPFHNLSEINPENRMAWCTVCGPTKVRQRSDNQKWRCVTSEKATKYGLEPGQFHKLITKQGNRCAICHKRMHSPHIDHDHRTQRVRGLLCSNCNTGIGLLGDSPERLLSAILYLEPKWVDKS